MDGNAGREQKTGEYWILPGSGADPRMSREQNESSLSDLEGLGGHSDDMCVAFTQEVFSGTVPIQK